MARELQVLQLTVSEQEVRRVHLSTRLEAIAFCNKKLLGAPGLTTRSKDATRAIALRLEAIAIRLEAIAHPFQIAVR